MYSGWSKKTLKHEISLWQLIRSRGIIHGTKPKHSSNACCYSLERPLYRLKTLLSGGKSKIKTLQNQKPERQCVFRWRKQCHLHTGDKINKAHTTYSKRSHFTCYTFLRNPHNLGHQTYCKIIRCLLATWASIWLRGQVMKRSCLTRSHFSCYPPHRVVLRHCPGPKT